ncbi:Peptidase S8 and S53, subtilisin, kexin, sedolisin [Beggiatoa sp. PS]|nr:Peptidase S8 and S53, subtilisin, kexin, sedolisin [Beggiatoa sp. PS]
MWTILADIFSINIISRCLGLWFVGVALNFGAMSVVVAATNCERVEKDTGLPSAECKFLLHFYHRTGGVSWTNNDGWLENNEPCNWRGIECDESGYVSKISLSGNNLSGMIPQFDDLPNLQDLDIYNYRLCKHPYNDYGAWQSEVDQFPDCGMVAAFDVSSDRNCINLNPRSTFEVTLDATSSRNFNSDVIDHYRWTSNGQPLSSDSSIITVDYEELGEHKIGLFVEYGNPETMSNNDAQRVITVNECLYRLTVKKNGEGSGVVTDDQDIYCSDVCSKSYGLGYVNLNARPAAHSVFNGWTGACLAEGTNPSCTVLMNQRKSVGASFGIDSHTVQVQINGEGTVSGSGTHEYDTEVTLVANPKDNWYFDGWFGGSCSGTEPCVVTVDRDIKDITATFKQDVRELTVNIDGNGTVIGSNCSSNCKKSYEYETEVTLIAIPQDGWSFKGWADDCSSMTGNECTVTMDQPHKVTATFVHIHTLSVEIKDSVGGIVSSKPNGIDNCPYHCEKLYEHSTEVILTAIPDDGYVLARWSKNCREKDSNACTVLMEQTQYVMATFVSENNPILTLHVGTGGFVSSKPPDI